LFEPPEASQLATDAHAADIFGEDEDEEPEVDATADDEEQIERVGDETVGAVSELPGENPAGGLPGVAAAATAARFSQQQRLESRAEIIDEEPHLHWRYRACWGTIEKNAIASAFSFKRRKPLFTVSEDSVWRWADGVVETQLPRVGKIESLTATLYYTSGSRQAKADRCTIALQRSRRVAGEGVVVGNWVDFEEELVEMDKESAQIMTCDFDLVLKEELLASQPASQPARGVARQRPGIVTAIQEEGLASVVAAERSASGVAIGIKDYWRCLEEACSNNTNTCWRRPIPGRQIDRPEDHYKVNGNTIASWAAAVARQECTIEEPSDEIRLSLMMARDRAEAEKRRRRRKVSPTSSNSSIEGLTKAILAGHLAQMSAQRQCQYHLEERRERRVWRDFNCTRPELYQHTFNFFNYWSEAMPQLGDEITQIRKTIFREGLYDINMLMDKEEGMTLECWTEYFHQSPSMLSHLRRKAFDWRKDYGGLTVLNVDALKSYENDTRPNRETPGRSPLGEVNGNVGQSPIDVREFS
jgi:hypothetical protein